MAAGCVERPALRPGAEDNHVVRARIAHGLQEPGYAGDVVCAATARIYPLVDVGLEFAAEALAENAGSVEGG